MRLLLATTKLMLTITGLAAVAWLIAVFGYFYVEPHLINTADVARGGEIFTQRAVAAADAELAAASRHMRPSVLSYGVLISLMSAERAIANADADDIRAKLADLERRTKEALEREPTDAFLWLTLFWLNTRQAQSLSADDCRYLRMSYSVGPNEAWIAVKRNSLIWRFYPDIPADLVDAAAAEFVGLINSWLHHQAAAIVAGPGWPARDILLKQLKNAAAAQRQGFIDALRSRRPDDFPGLGLDDPAQRPWR
jgi:hypothetical protein